MIHRGDRREEVAPFGDNDSKLHGSSSQDAKNRIVREFLCACHRKLHLHERLALVTAVHMIIVERGPYSNRGVCPFAGNGVALGGTGGQGPCK